MLTPEFRQKIWQYLTNDLQEKHRDCQDFVQAIAPHFDGSALARIDYHTDLEFKNQEEYFNPGDVITWYQLLDNNQIKFTHFAVALGDGLYLCKFGLEIIGVATMESMCQAYKTPYYAKLAEKILNNPCYVKDH